MRDVNGKIEEYVFSGPVKFYLNYEGCKLSFFVPPFNCFWSFIWTMRDVNEKIEEMLLNPDTSFIWTMRDVNKVKWDICCERTSRFYLNYEGCKRLGFREEWVWRIWFYLNYEGCKRDFQFIIEKFKDVFYLNYEGCKRF